MEKKRLTRANLAKGTVTVLCWKERDTLTVALIFINLVNLPFS
jgi:hypothetical protein